MFYINIFYLFLFINSIVLIIILNASKDIKSTSNKLTVKAKKILFKSQNKNTTFTIRLPL